MSSYRDEARRALESSVARESQNEYLSKLQSHHPALQGFDGVDRLLEMLRDPLGNADQKDSVLLALLQEYQVSSSGGAFALLATAMFPALDRIFRARRRRVREADDLWGRVVGAFAEAIDRYPTQRRPRRVAANIEGDTMAHLRRGGLLEVRTAMARDLLTEAIAPYIEEIEAVDPEVAGTGRMGLGDFAKPGSELSAQPSEDELEEARGAVAPLFDATGIAPEDRFLILGVHLYERTLGELAAEIGISREAAKKRHLRALNRLRKIRNPAGMDGS
jgi:DNA-directed RNA polymerase specialized sigma24 family protein